MIPTEKQRAQSLAKDIHNIVGIDRFGGGECILPNLRDALQALGDLCRDASPTNEVQLSSFAALMYIARGEADRLMLLERLQPAHRDLLAEAVAGAAEKIVADEGKPRRAA